ncbi:alpha-galactosidase [Oceaniglobus trochenteri]|uniref:alpha-galactosidase n=1 Tax=Oceaniglobus trochenteri TaxID=2763260 RepID=UPI001CFF5B29|nr:alpha-galactosidase [Oceaniglobus trochenteri]
MTDETIRAWRMDTRDQTLVLVSRDDALPECIYWGAPLPEDEDLETLASAAVMDVTGGMLDASPPLSLSPEARRSFPGQPGMMLRDGGGAIILPTFALRDVTTSDTINEGHPPVAGGGEAPARGGGRGMPGLPPGGTDGDVLRFTCEDARNALTYTATFTAHDDLITARATLTCGHPIHLDWLAAPVLPAPQLADEVIDVSGRWIGEFRLNRTPWTPGIHMRESRTGRSGHEHFPGLILPCRGTTNTQGQAFGLHYGWSGGHRMIAEELPDGRRQVQFGHAAQSETEPGTRFETAKIYLTHSTTGLNGIATAHQRHARDRIVTWPHPDRPRPVHYNCWEAVYFNHDLAELKDIASRAAALGAERFVLDDGWFGRRDDDTTSLGDWVIDPRKYPGGLTPLIDHVKAEGMGFGIWFEPEMVNRDSDLARAHPDWILGPADQIPGRQQFVLNIALPEVREYLYNHIAAVLSAHDVDYVKWDHNRVLPAPDAAQTRGTYALFDRLRADFPHVELESCASGGGRIDFGILKRTARVWLSDSNDALERLRIQHDAALFLPMAVTGSHVGPRQCHTSGRVLDIRFRAWVAAQRHMGFEMDPRELTEDEARVLQEVTAWWKANRGWMCRGDILRLDSADPSVIAEQQLSRDGARFVVFAGEAETSAQIAPRPLRLTGLDAGARYRMHLANRADAVGLSRGDPALKSGDIEVSGQYLMQHGLTLPWAFPQSMWVIEGTRL